MSNQPAWLTEDVFQKVFETKYGKNFQIKSFTVALIEDSWDKTPTYRVQTDIEFKAKNSSSIFGCGHKKFQETISYLLRLSPESEIEMFDKVIPAFEKLYADKGKNVIFSQKPQKIYHNMALLFEDPKSKCLKKFKNFHEDVLNQVLEKLAQFHAASAVYAGCNNMENLIIKVEKSKEILDIFVKKVKPTIIENCEQGKYFGDKFFGEKVVDFFDSKEFNVLNHGQCWSNNILFGNSDEIYFTDFQLPKFGSPALDLYYLLLSATTEIDKTKKFDYFIKKYYDCLVDNLKLLDYKKEIPYLTDLRISLIRHGIWARIAICGVVSISLRPDKGELYNNEAYVKVLQDLLPWMDNRGLLEHIDSPKAIVTPALPKPIEVVVDTIAIPEKRNPSTKVDPRIPRWIKQEIFEQIVKKEMGGFSRITEFRTEAGTSADNTSLLLRTHIEAELEGVGNYEIILLFNTFLISIL